MLLKVARTNQRGPKIAVHDLGTAYQPFRQQLYCMLFSALTTCHQAEMEGYIIGSNRAICPIWSCACVRAVCCITTTLWPLKQKVNASRSKVSVFGRTSGTCTSDSALSHCPSAPLLPPLSSNWILSSVSSASRARQKKLRHQTQSCVYACLTVCLRRVSYSGTRRNGFLGPVPQKDIPVRANTSHQ